MNNALFAGLMENTRSKKPLVHCITNYVTVNDVANIVLACGASPVMADDIGEVADITAVSQATVINIGTLNSRTIESMMKAGITAAGLHHPVVLDPVGAGASELRKQTVYRLLDEIKFTVIRGNMSEIKTIAQGHKTGRGVDAAEADCVTEENLPETTAFVKALAVRTGAVIAMTGAIDLIASADTVYVCRNGHKSMSTITGSGCMLSALVAAFCGANPSQPLEAVAAAVSVMGVCGETAHQKTEMPGEGSGSFRSRLIDAVNLLTAEVFEKECRLEQF
jgi:hydroxyethylthiazole kinase